MYLVKQLEVVRGLISRRDLVGTVAPRALKRPQFEDCVHDLLWKSEVDKIKNHQSQLNCTLSRY